MMKIKIKWLDGKMVRWLGMFFLYSYLSIYLYASGPGTHGMDFLKLKLSARQLGMGNTFIAVADDVNTQFYNPSGLINLAGQELTFTQLSYLQGITYRHAGYGIPGVKGKGATSFGFSILQSRIEETDIQSNRIGDIMTTGMVWTLAHARRVIKSFSLGLCAKMVTFQLGDNSASTNAFDIGGYYAIPESGFSVGCVAENLSGKYKFIEQEESISANYKLGVARKFLQPKLTLAFDVINSENSYYYNLGLEQRIIKLIDLRAGYKIGYDLETYSLGIGINHKLKWLDEIQFDYANVPMGELGVVNIFSLITRF